MTNASTSDLRGTNQLQKTQRDYTESFLQRLDYIFWRFWAQLSDLVTANQPGPQEETQSGVMKSAGRPPSVARITSHIPGQRIDRGLAPSRHPQMRCPPKSNIYHSSDSSVTHCGGRTWSP
ncbi:Hypothetical predicted protein [Pelobates cultripes]|uniref:Uncharacterized protein n=1 Tax=Pelobates cultripes TaxID=61616 RepID=A0AAD1SGE0_PELCU|nr:Hypothetical predicted protein [Pelobates cultripes]